MPPSDAALAKQLNGARLPSIGLPATDGTTVELAALRGRRVIYVYPMTGRPGVPLPEGWDEIPGARGCTPQSCSFRDHHAELEALDTGVLGLSAQDAEDQREARDRLHLPFQLLSDAPLALRDALGLPTFRAAGMELYVRLTLIATDAVIEHVFHPIPDPARNADDVLAWLRRTGAGARR